MERETIKQAIYEHFIEPNEHNDRQFIGVEIEIPVVNLSGQMTDQKLAQSVFDDFVRHKGFVPDKFDDNGVCYSATDPRTRDNVSFDCSYNNLEFSFGREETIHGIQRRFNEYAAYFNSGLAKGNHILTGLGINPNYRVNDSSFIPSGRYRMLERYLSRAKVWNYPMYFHPYVTYGTFASASQVQLDIDKESLVETLNAFTLLEPVKAVLFSNSYLPDEPGLLCSRDLLWENSTHGINPHNVGMYDYSFGGLDDLTEYLSSASLFTVERGGRTILFKPIIATEYFNMDSVEGEWFDGESFKAVTFRPEPGDLKYLRTYNYQDVTYRGTVEFRSCCTQPFSDAMTVAAFHLGLSGKISELTKLLREDRILYGRGHSAVELRKLLNRRDWPDYISRPQLTVLVTKVLDLAKYGLMERGFGEEIYLEPLYERAAKLESPALRARRLIEGGVPQRDVIEMYAKLRDFEQ